MDAARVAIIPVLTATILKASTAPTVVASGQRRSTFTLSCPNGQIKQRSSTYFQRQEGTLTKAVYWSDGLSLALSSGLAGGGNMLSVQSLTQYGILPA